MYEIELYCFEGDEVEMEVYCLKGIYICIIVDDLGEMLGCGVYVIMLCCVGVVNYLYEWMVMLE